MNNTEFITKLSDWEQDIASAIDIKGIPENTKKLLEICLQDIVQTKLNLYREK